MPIEVVLLSQMGKSAGACDCNVGLGSHLAPCCEQSAMLQKALMQAFTPAMNASEWHAPGEWHVRMCALTVLGSMAFLIGVWTDLIPG